jgi:hypothetical protein
MTTKRLGVLLGDKIGPKIVSTKVDIDGLVT